jgi:hypothetical protein
MSPPVELYSILKGEEGFDAGNEEGSLLEAERNSPKRLQGS